MKSYHFIKYHEQLQLESLFSSNDHNTVICFDLEDSIQDYQFPNKTKTLKASYRTILKTLLDSLPFKKHELKMGVRINEIGSFDYWEDLEILSEIKTISSLFVPKISSSVQVKELIQNLQLKNIVYDELILVIESRDGFQNLSEIIYEHATEIGSIAFGHCDYNFDIQQYPFFHQDTREYWNWIKKFSDILRPYSIPLINSPYLQLGDDTGFNDMLVLLNALAGENAGQVTLTKNQSEICSSFQADENKLPTWKKNRLNLRVPDGFAEKFVSDFEQNNASKGFSIAENRVVLSPQEYKASKDYLESNNKPEINFSFVGGCFPVQGEISFEKLFHQQLKRKVEAREEVHFNVNIIRYERFSDCLQKIKKSHAAFPQDILVFSIRPEPFLRIIKLYYKYLDPKTERKRSELNLPIFKQLIAEKFDLLSLNERFSSPVYTDVSSFRKILIDLNYWAGSLIGNQYFALKSYLKLVTDVIAFCDENQIRLLILGPPVRSNTSYERTLSSKLNASMKKRLANYNLTYINGNGLPLENEKKQVIKGVFADEAYHTFIANELEKAI